MLKKIYITSTLPYPNSLSGAHIGHLFEFVLTDAISRYFKSKIGQENVFFNTGLDEEGLKIWEKAEELNIPVEVFLEQQNIMWKDFCNKFQIEYDNFYRTSSPIHQKNVQKFWNECMERGDIYKKTYSGKYCVGCESFKLERELIDGKCPDHLSVELKITEEENYFFRLTKYQKHLSDWINNNPEFLLPQNKTIELKNFIDNIIDIPISRLRKNVPWGTEVPDDKEQTIYIWFSALLNYLFSCKYYENKEEFNNWWQDTVQVCGPDNLRFQAVTFQAMLASAGIKQTGKLLVHGTIIDANGKKMSKTDGNVIDPIDQLNKYRIDAVRYYALAGLRTYGNSGWDEEQLVNIYNAHLADNYGNLLTRVVHLINLKEQEAKDNEEFEFDWSDDNKIDKKLFESQFNEIKELWDTYEISTALAKLNDVLKEANQYITEKAPWGKDAQDVETVLSTLYWVLEEATLLYLPVIPNKAKQALDSLYSLRKEIVFPKIELKKEVTL